MRHILDLLYLLVLVLFFPWLLFKALTTGKYRRGLLDKLAGLARPVRPLSGQRRVWFHAVSVGEVLMLRQVIAEFRRRHPNWDVVISTTTDTGFEEARKRFPELTIFFFPFDFSWAVRRALRRVAPQLVILAEGELWPNFLTTCKRFDVPIVVVNARMSPRSAARYRRVRWLTPPLWNAVDRFAIQTTEYAENFKILGVAAEKLIVTGNVKYDGVKSDCHNAETLHFQNLFAIQNDDLVLIAGSTQAPEEEIALGIFLRQRQVHANLRLILVPRQRERFDEVASLLRRAGVPFVRRSTLNEPVTDRSAVILVDAIGELGAIWGLATVAFVGGSLDGKRGGQNMIEPAAYGAAVVFGPHVWNFRDPVARLLACQGAVQVRDGTELGEVVGELLADPQRRQALGAAAREFVASQQGATGRTLDVIDATLAGRANLARRAA